jgi:hypothetical protein
MHLACILERSAVSQAWNDSIGQRREFDGTEDLYQRKEVHEDIADAPSSIDTTSDKVFAPYCALEGL